MRRATLFTLYLLWDADGKGEDGEQAEGRDGGMHGRREVCVHLAGGDEELLQIQPALSAAALWVFLARTRVPCVTELYLWCAVCQRLMMSRRRQKTRFCVRMCRMEMCILVYDAFCTCRDFSSSLSEKPNRDTDDGGWLITFWFRRLNHFTDSALQVLRDIFVLLLTPKTLNTL